MKLIITQILIIVLLSSCDMQNRSKFLLPNASGNPSEVVLIIDKHNWKSRIGDSIQKLLLSELYGLPQSEPMFDLVHIPSKAFSSIFQTHRNLILTQISSEIKKPKITLQRNVWAAPQVVIKIVAPNDSSFIKIFQDNKNAILDTLLKSERTRLIKNYKKYESYAIVNHLENKYKISMHIPKNYTISVSRKKFVWLSHETPEISQGIIAYTYQYKNTSMFSAENLIKMRDSIFKKNVPGPAKGSYMVTEKLIEPSYKEIMFNGKYAVLIKGLWKVKGDFMGGPFISLSTFDKERNRIVTVEGFVYAPKFDKRNYLRQVEAILYTLDFVNGNVSKDKNE